MVVKIFRSSLEGHIEIPSSKSQVIRSVICASLAKGVTQIKNTSLPEDVEVVINAMVNLGANISISKEKESNIYSLTITGGQYCNLIAANINCNQSATVFRFLLSLCAVLGITTTFSLDGSLIKRPFLELTNELQKHGVNYIYNLKKCKIASSGKLSGLDFYLSGNISSQYVSGLLISLPLMQTKTNKIATVNLTSKLQSQQYVDITIDTLQKFNIKILKDKNKFLVPTNQKFESTIINPDGDYSLGANFLVAKNLNSPNLKISNLNSKSLQGDKIIEDIINKIETSPDIKEIKIDATNCIDLVPILVVLMVYKKINAQIHNIERLKIKESNRLEAICQQLKKMGAKIKYNENQIFINGNGKLKGGTFLDGYNDHRIIMALAIAGLMCNAPIMISDAEAVSKSYPEFWQVLKQLGAKFEILK